LTKFISLIHFFIYAFCPESDNICHKEARNAGKIQIPLFCFLSWLHGFLMIRRPGRQEKEKSLGEGKEASLVQG
jgi:hypothetical protein